MPRKLVPTSVLRNDRRAKNLNARVRIYDLGFGTLEGATDLGG